MNNKKGITIVLVGGECVGKTTLAQTLSEKYGYAIEKNVAIKDAYQVVSKVVTDINSMQLRTSGGSNTVLDRWQLVDDGLYCSLFNHCSSLEPIEDILYSQCARLGVYFIYLDIAKEEMLKRFRQRGDEFVNEEIAEKAWQAYPHWYAYMTDIIEYDRLLKLDVTGLTTEEVAALVLDYVENH